LVKNNFPKEVGLVPKLWLSSLYTSPAKPGKPSFRHGCRNPGHGR